MLKRTPTIGFSYQGVDLIFSRPPGSRLVAHMPRYFEVAEMIEGVNDGDTTDPTLGQTPDYHNEMLRLICEFQQRADDQRVSYTLEELDAELLPQDVLMIWFMIIAKSRMTTAEKKTLNPPLNVHSPIRPSTIAEPVETIANGGAAAISR